MRSGRSTRSAFSRVGSQSNCAQPDLREHVTFKPATFGQRPVGTALCAINMKFSDIQKSALQLNELYEQLEIKKYGRIWTTEELALGFVGDVGDLAKLIQANAGVRNIDDHKEKLGHELSDCLWSIIVLANKCGVDLEAEFFRNVKGLSDYVSSEVGA